MTRKSKSGAVLILILLVGILSLAAVQLSVKMALLAVSQVYIEPQGEESATGEWTGSYWVVLATTTGGDIHEFVLQFPEDVEERADFDATTNTGEELEVRGSLLISMTPETPYWERSLEAKSWVVTPKTWGTWINKIQKAGDHPGRMTDTEVEAVTAEVWEPTGVWIRHAPFTLKVEKVEGENLFSHEELIDVTNTADVATTITNPNDPSEKFTITVHGQLGTGPSIGGVPDDFIIFRDNTKYSFVGSDALRREIKYDQDDHSYSNYWFGGGNYYLGKTDVLGGATGIVERWEDNGSPAHFILDAGTARPLKTNLFPGSYRGDTSLVYKLYAVRPDVWNDNPDTNPYGLSLINYLTKVRGYSTIDWSGYYGRSWDISNDKLTLYLPVNSVTEIVTLRISTELADSYVYRPAIGNFKITGYAWLSTGTAKSVIGDKDIMYVDVENLAKNGAVAQVFTEPAEDIAELIAINPTSDAAVVEDDKTFTFMVTNLGAFGLTDIESTIDVYVKDQFTGEEQARVTFQVTLKPKGEPGGETEIIIWTLDKETEDKVNGITVTIDYDSSADSKVTLDGKVKFTLPSYEGSVTITTIQTNVYQSWQGTEEVSPGENVVYAYLLKHGVKRTTNWTWLIIAIVAAVAVTAAVVGYKKRRKLKAWF